MKRLFFVLSSLAVVFTAMHAIRAQGKTTVKGSAAGFEKLKLLAGEWQGQGPHGQTTASYQIISGGSAVMETLLPPDEPSMVTLYHLDGDKLMMTHYCSSGNQPRMQAEAPAGEIKKLDFSFVDATNLAKPAEGHMVHLTITFQDQDHLTQVWTWRQDGKDTPATFSFAR